MAVEDVEALLCARRSRHADADAARSGKWAPCDDIVHIIIGAGCGYGSITSSSHPLTGKWMFE